MNVQTMDYVFQFTSLIKFEFRIRRIFTINSMVEIYGLNA